MGLAYLDLPASEREWWIARHEKRAAEHSCGHPREVCADPKKPWYPQRTVCYPTMEREAAAAKYARLHSELKWHNGDFTSWAKDPDDSHPYSYEMGVTVWVAQQDYNPNDAFLSGESLSPNLAEHVADSEGGEGDG